MIVWPSSDSKNGSALAQPRGDDSTLDVAENHKKQLRPIYIIDDDIKNRCNVGINRVRFLLESLIDLNSNLRKLNLQLYVVNGKPLEVFSKLFTEWKVDFLTFEKAVEPEIIEEDEHIEELSNKNNVFVVQRISHTIYDCQSIINKNNGNIPLTYPKFLSLVQDVQVKITNEIIKPVSNYCQPSIDAFEKQDPNCYDVNQHFKLSSEDLSTEICYPGGETEALKRLNDILQKKDWICNFEKPNTSPNSLEPSTTVLSPYISLGCLSAKLFYKELKTIERNHPHTKPPVSLLGQLMWREFYYVAATGTVNFDKMIGNPICMQIPWDKNESFLKAWAEGKTGYPFIDAIMKQLISEGWIHHLARHMVACFLTRGDLWISWEEGAKIFEKYLLDYDWALNSGNWLWLSASAFFYKYFRVYSPIAFGKKTDKDGLYIRKYVPELKKYPSEYIYEPWKAPLSVQKQANCIIGTRVDLALGSRMGVGHTNEVVRTDSNSITIVRPIPGGSYDPHDPFWIRLYSYHYLRSTGRALATVAAQGVGDVGDRRRPRA
ncbi:Cryptochrome-1 [Eumeta japonica]|uniref:Cryptochrome-1 n=1 Tax=Eumeta variegata TaxID=151549 RepID=A0A4C1XPF9_EUMVA|nr:Cryptochrome-1 [Eumeta japonica]